jgi:hypothetical protein
MKFSWKLFVVMILAVFLGIAAIVLEAKGEEITLAYGVTNDCKEYWLHVGKKEGVYMWSFPIGNSGKYKYDTGDHRYLTFAISCGENGFIHPEDEIEWGVKPPTGVRVIRGD